MFAVMLYLISMNSAGTQKLENSDRFLVSGDQENRRIYYDFKRKETGNHGRVCQKTW